MKQLTAQNVELVFHDCLFLDGEDTTKAIIVEGIVHKVGFHPERLAKHKTEIYEMLCGLPDTFRADMGGGWSFLNACMTKDGDHWGEHSNIEQLLTLGIASDHAKILMPREMWNILPGGMPYFAVTTHRLPTP